MKTDTPLTDAARIDNADLSDWGIGKSELVHADFARQLERENTEMRAALLGTMGIIDRATRKGELRPSSKDVNIKIAARAILAETAKENKP